MHTYGMLPPAGALICCWDLQYERAWGMAARNLRIGWVVSTVQDEQDERGVGAPRPKRARSCSPPARLSGIAQDTAQDKPLRKVAWKLLASDVAGIKLKVQDAFKNEQALFDQAQRVKMTRLRKTLDETVNQWIETGVTGSPTPKKAARSQSPTGVAMVVRVEAATPAATPAATSVPLDLRESAERIETLEARDDMGQRVAEGRPPPSRSRGQIWWL